MNKFKILYVVTSILFSNSSIIGRTILAKTNSSEGKPDPVEQQDQQYKITLKIEGKADRTAKAWKFTNLFVQYFD